MYDQALLFEGPLNRLPFLDSGINGRVYDCGATVVKLSKRSDSTRNWLEFCMNWREKHGTLMPLMPEIYSLVDCWGKDWRDKPEKGYVVAMKKYTRQPGYYPDRKWGRDDITRIQKHPAFDDVSRAYSEYLHRRCDSHREVWNLFDDCHGSNIMMDGKRPIILDPSNGSYLEPYAPYVLELEMA
jgi:hypothetical protein